ncbi:MAG TPA: RsmE family RNA methyltransferase [Deltaproteobacteria bacterium]|nr:RsmE family RNA methyltransferase [Deltaproteobacteria bacterium]HQI80637.1 RsmE family RNA methyltransferase [Deltaproteobacteria bacterium]
MPRFFAEILNHRSARITDRAAVHHITGPLRRRTGDELAIRVGPQGYRARITGIRKESLLLEILREETLQDRCAGAIHLCLCLFDLRDMEETLRYATELGVTAFHTAVSTRSSVRSITASRMARWHAIVQEAVKQCERRSIPPIHGPLPLEDLVRGVSRQWGLRLFAHRDAVQRVPAGVAGDAGIVIGPEGGFTPEEVRLMEADGMTPASLGGTTLRAVTSAIAAVGLLGQEPS